MHTVVMGCDLQAPLAQPLVQVLQDAEDPLVEQSWLAPQVWTKPLATGLTLPVPQVEELPVQ
jgi:hypothetical protein